MSMESKCPSEEIALEFDLFLLKKLEGILLFRGHLLSPIRNDEAADLWRAD